MGFTTNKQAVQLALGPTLAGCQVTFYFNPDKAARLSSFDCCEHVLLVEESSGRTGVRP